MPKGLLPTPKEVIERLLGGRYESEDPEVKLTEIMTGLPFETLRDLRTFVRHANAVRRLSKACDPEVVKEAVMLEKRMRVAIESIREDWRNKVIPAEVAREAIDFIYSTADESVREAYLNLEACFRR